MDQLRAEGIFTYHLSDNLLFKKDNANFIDALGINQLKEIGNVYLLDVFLSKGNCVEFHYHPNAAELTYCIRGEVQFGFMNFDTKEWQNFIIQPGEVITIPQGWWHYACATKDDTHLLAIHDTNNLETVFGSDILRTTPKKLLSNIYCLNEAEITEALAPIQDTVVIGPPENCKKGSTKTQTVIQKNHVLEAKEEYNEVAHVEEYEKNKGNRSHFAIHYGDVQAITAPHDQRMPSHWSQSQLRNICPTCQGYY